MQQGTQVKSNYKTKTTRAVTAIRAQRRVEYVSATSPERLHYTRGSGRTLDLLDSDLSALISTQQHRPECALPQDLLFLKILESYPSQPHHHRAQRIQR